MRLQDLVPTPSHWTPHHAAEDSDGGTVSHLSAAAVKFSLQGAAAKIADRGAGATDAEDEAFYRIRLATWEALEKLHEGFCVGYSDVVLSEQFFFYDSDADAALKWWEGTEGRTFDEVHAVAVLADSILAGGVAEATEAAKPATPPAPDQPSPPPPIQNRFTRLQDAMAAVGADYCGIEQRQELYPGRSPRPPKWECTVIRKGLIIVCRDGASRSEVMEAAIESLGRLKKYEESAL